MNKTNRTLGPASSMPAPLAPAAIDDGFIKSRIHTIRGEQMMLSSDLAELYDVEVKYLHRQVKRNQPRFPTDFVVHLSPDELKGLRCQIVTSNRGGDRYGLLAFTEQGVAMLSTRTRPATRSASIPSSRRWTAGISLRRRSSTTASSGTRGRSWTDW